MISSRWLLLLGVSIVVLGTGFAAATEPPQPSDESLSVTVYQLKHLETKEAQLVIRTIYEARRVAELPDRGVLVVADTPARPDAIGKLLERIDLPPAKGRAVTAGPGAGTPGPDIAAKK